MNGNAPALVLENLTYDKHGNIKTLRRKWNGETVDGLTYTYASASNRLVSVNESPNGQTQNLPHYEFFDESKTPGGSTIDYTYDDAGNMLQDANKGIANGEIVYNYLNLPSKIKNNKYVYTATGETVHMETANGIFDYMGGVVFKNSKVESVPTANGRALPPGTAFSPEDPTVENGPMLTNENFWRYEYQLTDHLGNMRVACRCQEKKDATRPEDAYPPRIVQQAHYDPWGVHLPIYGNPDPYLGKPSDRFLYNGKEYENQLDLYNFGARMYDPTIGRWGVPDPIDQFTDFSPYGFVLNNPVNLTDPDGMQVGMGSPLLQFLNRSGASQVSTAAKVGVIRGAVQVQIMMQPLKEISNTTVVNINSALRQNIIL
ncbi:RHS repeat domain-containing protein [Emticicia sp. C21]|uniref:RHS repeat domain-containing protein n=1 Tax=Emticicia sp. C21 TaxID=2302915 RepID=UPI000E98C866|nr:RHS repeat-associated core domain-containing protein [Emticicia sp. C21]RFS14942.1 RHS repeat-associated core domain-containing protein [Emticicia sp. C21]